MVARRKCFRKWFRGLPFVLFVTVCLLSVSLLKLYSMWSDTRGSYVYVYDEGSTLDDAATPIRLPDLATVRDLAHRVLAVARNLRTSSSSNLKDILELNSVALQLYPLIDVGLSSAQPFLGQSSTISSPVVCPEEYLGNDLLDKAWKTTNCTTAPPIRSLVTVLILQDDEGGHSERLKNDFQSAYPGIGIQTVDTSQTGKSSWKEAIHSVNTPYVLVAREMFAFSADSSSLERLVRVLNATAGVAAVGGAVTNATGHWSVPCFQTLLRDYALVIRAGYYHSHAECMFCDHLDGPFVIRTSRLLRADIELPAQFRFVDLFLALSQRFVSMACPDVMFYANGGLHATPTKTPAGHRLQWIPFVRKWELNRVLLLLDVHQGPLARRVLHRFSCAESGVRCDDLMTSAAAYVMPPCCRDQMAAAYDVFASFCRNHSIGYYFDCGTALGAVKMAGVIPWDFDGDAVFAEANFSFVRKSSRAFDERGLSLKLVRTHSSTQNSLFYLWTPDVFVELYGEKRLPAVPATLMQVGGFWIRGPANPGKYARGRYGRDCLKHVQSWRHTGAANSFEPYAVRSSFAACPRPLHHSCLDRFPVDGNIPFQVPEW